MAKGDLRPVSDREFSRARNHEEVLAEREAKHQEALARRDAPPASVDEVAAMRAELAELRAAMKAPPAKK